MRAGMLLGMLALGACGAAMAQSTVELSRAVFVERYSASTAIRTVEPADSLHKGDTVILMVKWRKPEATRAGFTVSSAIPQSLQYQRSSDDMQTVSVDGGKNWGKLGSLKTADGRNTRLAAPEDVTHLRWRISARSAARGNGQVTYSAIVR